uniref:CNH domain-containing protein n=1 Tax=Mycena chlorophos TaxID=658473 RepID=A0ABQ0L8T0_MYCCL|nr:predicted protein [Mycena chlorophos]
MASHHIALFQRVALTAVRAGRVKQQQQHREQRNHHSAPQNARIPPLPIELFERIVDFLFNDKESLLACTLVCRAWLPTSRYHLLQLLPVLPDVLTTSNHRLNTAVLLAEDTTMYGTPDGIYVARDHGELVRFLKLPCAQIDALESHDMLFILSGRRLFIGPLHLAVGPHANPAQLHNHLEVISTDASFFKIGYHTGKHVLCIVNARHFSSHFKVLEAAHRPTNTPSNNLHPFRSFYLPDYARSVHIFNKTMGAALRSGFQCVDPLSLVTFPVPVSSQAASAPEDAASTGPRKCRAMFRVDARFLLCFDRCAFFIDKAGASSEHDFALRWTDSAKQFALANSQLLLVFVPGRMHVWGLDTGALVQTVVGGEGMQMLCASPRVLIRMGDGRVVRLKWGHGGFRDER